ncbi:MAG: DUF512 domain-containing protein [Clostridia bacterium]|nr:DUF512 domain-containing protein [Clostridia bacterium]
MSVIIGGIEPGSVAENSNITPGDKLISLNGNEIVDVLDYRFYQNNENVIALVEDKNGNVQKYRFKKDEYDELGFTFDTYLMDKQHSCKNKCIFCFIDQLPKGLRESLYFKDDDSRLSFLFGNYITLTNITEHEIERIIKMHISPINISVHTTNPELRVKMMKNKNAGEVLKLLKRFDNAGISMNSQLVLCPGYNDGEELKKTLSDLISLENMKCIAAVPVGLTKYREGLCEIQPFDAVSAEAALEIINEYGDKTVELFGERRVYASDEFYILSGRKIPDAEYYGDFLQLENGVGLSALLKSEVDAALADIEDNSGAPRVISLVTGVAAYGLIREICDRCEKKRCGLKCNVYPIKNNFFGEMITVSGLVTATDIIDQLKNEDLGEVLLIPACMLRKQRDMFLDSITLDQLSNALGVPVDFTENDGYLFVDKILGRE